MLVYSSYIPSNGRSWIILFCSVVNKSFFSYKDEHRIVLTGKCKKIRIKLALTPITTMGIRRVKRITVSRRFVSVKREINFVFKVPKATRLNNQMEYTAERTIPAVEKSRTVLFLEKTPRNNRSSPKKLEVPGKLIFARVNIKKKNVKIGITVTRPP